MDVHMRGLSRFRNSGNPMFVSRLAQNYYTALTLHTCVKAARKILIEKEHHLPCFI